MPETDVIIVGGGLAGLCCARRLHQEGIPFCLLEASDAVGGRVRTDRVEGFQLDRGFQVLLTAYPEAKQVWDYDSLELGFFEPGALVRHAGRFHHFVDPWRRPSKLVSTALSPLASLGDKLRVASLRRRVCRLPLEQLYQRPETSTLDALRAQGFSERMIDHFFRPFLGGIFLDPELRTSSRMFEFVFRMFSLGEAALPAHGMEALPRQIAEGLPQASIQCNARVVEVTTQGVKLEDGTGWSAKSVVVACEGPATAKLLGEQPPDHWQSVTCFYYAAPKTPVKEPILVLNGDGRGPINNLCVPSQVSPAYAPQGKSLVSVTVLGCSEDEALEQQVRQQLVSWFGEPVHDWQLLKAYPIHYALPSQSNLTPVQKDVVRADGIVVCGDYLDTASLQGAMSSGRRAAEAVIQREAAEGET